MKLYLPFLLSPYFWLPGVWMQNTVLSFLGAQLPLKVAYGWCGVVTSTQPYGRCPGRWAGPFWVLGLLPCQETVMKGLAA